MDIQENATEKILSEKEKTEEDSIKIREYLDNFIKHDKLNAIYHCINWSKTTGRKFTFKQPEDFVMELAELIYEGRRKCYLESYYYFKGSIYYHLSNMMKNYFGYNSKDDNNELDNENNISFSFSEKEIEFTEDFIDLNNAETYINGFDEIINKLYNEEEYENILKIFNQDDENESEEYLVVLYLVDNYKREEIAKELGISVEKVTNIKKRIKRKLIHYYNKKKKEG